MNLLDFFVSINPQTLSIREENRKQNAHNPTKSKQRHRQGMCCWSVWAKQLGYLEILKILERVLSDRERER